MRAGRISHQRVLGNPIPPRTLPNSLAMMMAVMGILHVGNSNRYQPIFLQGQTN